MILLSLIFCRSCQCLCWCVMTVSAIFTTDPKLLSKATKFKFEFKLTCITHFSSKIPVLMFYFLIFKHKIITTLINKNLKIWKCYILIILIFNPFYVTCVSRFQFSFYIFFGRTPMVISLYVLFYKSLYGWLLYAVFLSASS